MMYVQEHSILKMADTQNYYCSVPREKTRLFRLEMKRTFQIIKYNRAINAKRALKKLFQFKKEILTVLYKLFGLEAFFLLLCGCFNLYTLKLFTSIKELKKRGGGIYMTVTMFIFL